MERRLLKIGRNSAGWRRLPSLAAIWPLPKPADPPIPVESTRAQHPARPSLSTCAAARRLSGAASHSIQGIKQCQAAVASYVPLRGVRRPMRQRAECVYSRSSRECRLEAQQA